MLKIIFFFILFCYTIYRIGGFLLKILTFGATGSKNRVYKNGNVHVQKPPNQNKKSFDGGEYVDFEDVK